MTRPSSPPPFEREANSLSEAGEYLLQRRALERYNSEGLEESIGIFEQLVGMASKQGDVGKETDMRFWLGTTLHGRGQLVEAANAMAPALERSTFVGDRVLQNRLLTRYLLVAVDVPLPIEQLEAAFSQVAQVIESWGWADQESRLPLARGRLALYRGHRREALRWSRIAMNRRRSDPSSYAPHTYLMLYTKACQLAERPDLLKKLMDTGETFNNGSFPITRRIAVNLAQAEVARLEGCLDQALEFTRLAEQGAWMTQDRTYGTHALTGRARMLLAAGQTNEAQKVLVHLLRRRHTEVTHDGFEFRLLLGDYHLVEAQRQRPRGSAAVVKRHLAAATRAYGMARRFGMAVDARLRCHGKRNLANSRLREVAALSD